MANTGPPWSEDATLARRALSGDEAAWGEIDARCRPAVARAVVGMLRAYGRPAADGAAEEWVSDVFVKLLDRDGELLRRYDPRWCLETWLRVIARSHTRDRLRSAGIRVLRSPLPQEVLDPRTTVADPVWRRDGETVQRALAAMEPADRLLIEWIHVDGLSYREAGRLLGLKEDSVGPRLTRALARLRRHARDA